MIRLWRRSFVVVTRMVHYKVFGSRVGDMQRGGPTGENERSLELWMWICAVGLLPPEGAVVWMCECEGERERRLGKVYLQQPLRRMETARSMENGECD